MTSAPWPAETAYTGPPALTVGRFLSVVISSCMNEWSVPQSHNVTTTLRSTPRGRGGAGGTSPLSMRSVQSDNTFNDRVLAPAS